MARRDKRNFFVMSKDGLAFAPIGKLKNMEFELDNDHRAFVMVGKVPGGDDVVIGLWFSSNLKKIDMSNIMETYNAFITGPKPELPVLGKCYYKIQEGVALESIEKWYGGSKLQKLLTSKSFAKVMEELNIIL